MSLHENKITNYDIFEFELINNSKSELLTFKREIDRQIYEFLAKSGNTGKSREQISKEINVPRSSAYDSLYRMILSDLIEIDYKNGKKNKTKTIGRPVTLYYIKGTSQGRKR
jgi:predicted transcriptional regulator